MSYCVRCLVSGKVQGVWFRGATMAQARTLGVSGYARNLADGRVEVMACGSEDAVRRLCDWLWQGPATAEVNDVACQPVAAEEHHGFVTL